MFRICTTATNRLSTCPPTSKAINNWTAVWLRLATKLETLCSTTSKHPNYALIMWNCIDKKYKECCHSAEETRKWMSLERDCKSQLPTSSERSVSKRSSVRQCKRESMTAKKRYNCIERLTKSDSLITSNTHKHKHLLNSLIHGFISQQC
jgi:hypothetical protein